MTMVMLHRGRLFIGLVAILLFVSCSEKKNDDKTVIFKAISKHSIGRIEYAKIYNNIVDTLNFWKSNNLFGTSVTCNYSSFQVDSLLCFNKEKNRLITCILERECREDYADGIIFFYGAKIKGKWCFFAGGFICIPREYYVSKDKVNEPLSFTKLHEIAMKEVFGGYLKQSNKGKWEINDAFFHEFDASNWVAFSDRESDQNGFTSCANANNIKDYLECCYRKTAEKVWITEKQYVIEAVPIYESIHSKKSRRILEKGERIRVFEYVDGGKWCRILSAHNESTCSFIQRKYISIKIPKLNRVEFDRRVVSQSN
jgi:hypothetical protein